MSPSRTPTVGLVGPVLEDELDRVLRQHREDQHAAGARHRQVARGGEDAGDEVAPLGARAPRPSARPCRRIRCRPSAARWRTRFIWSRSVERRRARAASAGVAGASSWSGHDLRVRPEEQHVLVEELSRRTAFSWSLVVIMVVHSSGNCRGGRLGGCVRAVQSLTARAVRARPSRAAHGQAPAGLDQVGGARRLDQRRARDRSCLPRPPCGRRRGSSGPRRLRRSGSRARCAAWRRLSAARAAGHQFHRLCST